MTKDLSHVLKQHPFLADLEPDQVAFIVGCAKSQRFRAGEFLAREGVEEEEIFLIREGSVAIEAYKPGGVPVTLETLEAGDVLGVSRVMPTPADFDCRARETVLAFSLDRACLQRKMEADPSLGFALTQRFLERTYARLSRLRLQAADLYA